MNPALNLAKSQVRTAPAASCSATPGWPGGPRRPPARRSPGGCSPSRGCVDVDWYAIQARRSFGGVSEAVDALRRDRPPAGPLAEPAVRAHPHRPPRTAAGWRRVRADRRASCAAPGRRRPARTRCSTRRSTWPQNPKAAKHRFGAWGHFLEHATDDTPLPLSPTIGGMSTEGVVLRWGAWRAVRRRAACAAGPSRRAIADPPRVMAGARRRGREGAARRGRRVPAAAPAARRAAGQHRHRGAQPAQPGARGDRLGDAPRRSRDWEMIVVDDGSDDTTPDGVAEVARLDPRVRLVRRSGEGVSRGPQRRRRRGPRPVPGLARLATTPGRRTSSRRWSRRCPAAACAPGTRRARWSSEDGIVYREFADAGRSTSRSATSSTSTCSSSSATLVDEVGGFDPGLPRAVDYDLVYKVAKRADARLRPVPRRDVRRRRGRRAPDQRQGAQDLELRGARAPRRSTGTRVAGRRRASGSPGRVSVVVAGREDWRLMWATVLTPAAHTPAGGPVDLEVVVVDGASTRTPTLVIAALEALDPRVRVVRTVANYNLAGGRNIGIAPRPASTSSSLAAGVTVPEGWAQPLLERARRPGRRRGLAAGRRLGPPRPLGRAWCCRRTRRCRSRSSAATRCRTPAGSATGSRSRRSPSARSPSRAADAVAVRGFDPLYIDAYDDADFSLRLRGARPAARCVRRAGRPAWSSWCTPSSGRTRCRCRTGGSSPPAGAARRRRGDELWAARRPRACRATGRSRRTTSTRTSPTTRTTASSWSPVLHAVARRPGAAAAGRSRCRTCRPRWPQLDGFGAEVAAALERRGVAAVSRRASGRNRTPAYLDDVLVTLRGVPPDRARSAGRPVHRRDLPLRPRAARR